MRVRSGLLLVCLLASAGCAREKTTDELLDDLKAPGERERVIAVRSLPGRSKDAARIVPALIEALKDTEPDIRRSAALGLRSFGPEAKDAIAPLQKALADRDARVREAARLALARIEPK